MKKTRGNAAKINSSGNGSTKSNQGFFLVFILAFALTLFVSCLIGMAFVTGLDYASGIYLGEKVVRPAGMERPDKLLGGDRDEHGCIGSAGYLWCEAAKKCIRPWEEPCDASGAMTDEQRVRKYLEENISSLAPEKAVLGGTFFLTEFNLLSDKTAFIGYEDGHNLYNAEVVFAIANGEVRIEKIVIKNKNGEEYALQACKRDSDCLPMPSDCHPRSCINKRYAGDFTKPEMCTMMYDTQAAYEASDCFCDDNNECANKKLLGAE